MCENLSGSNHTKLSIGTSEVYVVVLKITQQYMSSFEEIILSCLMK